MSKRFIVKESYGYGHRAGIRINETTAPREVSQSRKNALIREYRSYASGFADIVHEVAADVNAGWQLVTARHWINGFENVRILHIRPSNIYQRITLGLED